MAWLSVELSLNAAHATGAQTPVHHNSVDIARAANAGATFTFTFALNMPQVMHGMLAPEIDLAKFLDTQANLSDRALDREIAKMGANFSKSAFLILSNGLKVQVKHWQFPDLDILRNTFKSALMLLNMPAATAAHIDPLRVHASVQSAFPLPTGTRAQIQLPAIIYPILVVSKNDKFWLTEQTPVALFDLE